MLVNQNKKWDYELDEDEAVLSSYGHFTSFKYKNYNIRFRTSPALDRYLEILEWDYGYLVVTALYKGQKEEEYIDLVPILQNLYIDIDQFLNQIKKVRIHYDTY